MNATFCLKRRKIFSVFPCFLKLLVIVFVWRVFCTLLPIVWRPCFIVSAPVPFAYNPGQNVHFVMEFCWEFDADQVWCTRPLPSGNQLHIIIIAAVLSCQRCALQREHGADAVSCSGLIDLQFFLWATCIFPAKVFPLNSIIDFSSAVCNFSGVGAWAAGKIIDHFVHVFLQELTFAAHPSFATISVCLRTGNGKLKIHYAASQFIWAWRMSKALLFSTSALLKKERAVRKACLPACNVLMCCLVRQRNQTCDWLWGPQASLLQIILQYQCHHKSLTFLLLGKF